MLGAFNIDDALGVENVDAPLHFSDNPTFLELGRCVAERRTPGDGYRRNFKNRG
jgi:hypothetical protein